MWVSCCYISFCLYLHIICIRASPNPWSRLETHQVSRYFIISKILGWIVPYGLQKVSIWNHVFVFSDVYIYIQCFLFQYHIRYMFHFTTPSGMGFISFVIHLRIVYDDLKPFFGFLPQSHAIQISSRRVKRFTSWTILKCNWTVESINGWIPEEGSIQEEWRMGCEFLKQ